MQKITFINGQAPALNAYNLNLLQTNVENAIATAKQEIETEFAQNIQKGTSLPSSATNGTIFLLYTA